MPVLNKHKDKIQEEQLLELDGLDLVCFCAPKRCHGHTTKKIIKEIKENNT